MCSFCTTGTHSKTNNNASFPCSSDKVQIWKLGHRLVFVIENSDKVTHGDSKDGGVLSLLNSPTAQLLEMTLACSLPPDRHEKPNIITENQNLYKVFTHGPVLPHLSYGAASLGTTTQGQKPCSHTKQTTHVRKSQKLLCLVKRDFNKL